MAIWLSTSKCDLSCRHCYVAGRFRGPELTTGEALKMVAELADMGVRHFSMTGGEPFLRPDVMELAREAYELGMHVSFTTNAIHIGDELARALRSIDAYIMVGLDGPDKEVCDAIRGPGAWKRTLKGITVLRSYGVSFAVVMTVSSLTYLSGRKHILFCEAVGAEEAIFLPLIPAGRAARAAGELMPTPAQVVKCLSDAEEAVEEIGFWARVWCAPFLARVVKSDRIYVLPCSDDVMDISPQGDVLFCDTLDFRVANVRGGVRKAWETYEAFRETLLAGRDVGRMRPCSTCPVREFCQGGCVARSILMGAGIGEPDPLCPFVSGAR